MAKSTPAQADNTRSASITVGTENGAGNAVLAAWQGIYHLFGGRASFDITPDGVVVNDFSVDGKYDPEQIVTDISHRNRRLDLIPTYLWATGTVPEPYTDAKEMTQFMVQFYRGALEEGSSRAPKYVRDAVANWKGDNNLAKKRGPKKKIFRVDNLSELDSSTLTGVDASELENLQAAIEAALAAQRANIAAEASVSEVANEAPEAVTA